MKSRIGLLLARLALLSVEQAAGNVITFDSLETPGLSTTDGFDFYSEEGFDLEASGFFSTQPGDFAYFHQSHFFCAGSAALFNDVSGGLTTLTKSDGGLFNLLAIELSEGFSDQSNPANER